MLAVAFSVSFQGTTMKQGLQNYFQAFVVQFGFKTVNKVIYGFGECSEYGGT